MWTGRPDVLFHVSPGQEEHSRVLNFFLAAWKHTGKSSPQIRNIFYVIPSGDAMSRFVNYRDRVGNTQQLFHGTRRMCSIGASAGATSSCGRADCNLCSILKGSYDIEKARNTGMFGAGIYSTNVSSKADGYASHTGSPDRLKSVILNHVVLGRTHLMRQFNHSMQRAPDNYDSVTGATVEQGGTLQYHEAAVYREDAMSAIAVVFYH